jgi:hypothetical protein
MLGIEGKDDFRGPGSTMALADGEETTWAISSGSMGCSLVSGGAQNPITYQSGELSLAFHSLPVFDGSIPRHRVAWEEDLRLAHNDGVQRFSVVQRHVGLGVCPPIEQSVSILTPRPFGRVPHCKPNRRSMSAAPLSRLSARDARIDTH